MTAPVSSSRRRWLKTAATMAAVPVVAPLLSSCGREGGAMPVVAEGGDRRWPDARHIIESLPDNIGCTGCEACMPCGYGVDIPGMFALYNRSLDNGDIPSSTDVLDTPDGLDRAVKFLRQAENEIGDTHMAHRCIACGHCLSSCFHRVKIVGNLHAIGSLIDLIRERQCQV